METELLLIFLLFAALIFSIVVATFSCLTDRVNHCSECILHGQNVTRDKLKDAVKRINESTEIEVLKKECGELMSIIDLGDKYMYLVCEFIVKLNNESTNENLEKLKVEISGIIFRELKHERKRFKQKNKDIVQALCLILLVVHSFFLFPVFYYLSKNFSDQQQDSVVILQYCVVTVGIIVVCISAKKGTSL